MTHPPLSLASRLRAGLALTFGLGLFLLPATARAQSAVIYGQLGNFDISNDTGRVCHGFQIDIDGVSAAEIPAISYFTANRYGTPTATPTATGVQIRWQSTYSDATQSWSDRTLQHTVSWFPGQCYQWVAGTYQDGGCEHFGVRTVNANGTVASRWLCEEPSTPGTLLAIDPPTAVAGPAYFVQPPVIVNNPPVLVVEVVAPEPAEVVGQYGDAQWERVFRTELQRPVALDELVADNPNVVPMNLAQLEADYSILQDEPAAGGKGNRRRHRHQSDLAPTTRSVVRRIELYRFTGNYDPVTHEALCADGTCNVPGAGELGELISVQMTAANVVPDAVLVTKSGTGSGSVDSKDKLVACGSKCAANYAVGNVVQLTAKAASGSDFAGWTGACSGTGACTVTVDGAVAVGAIFNTKPVAAGGGGGGGGGGSLFTLSIGRSNAGTVTGVPAGDKTLNCGSVCSAKFASGTQVTLTATPPAGKAFLSWGGGCLAAGANPVCAVTVTADTSVQANFSK
jgi:hypothetical protein